MLGGVAALIARLGMRREVALYCELNAPLMSRRAWMGLRLARGQTQDSVDSGLGGPRYVHGKLAVVPPLRFARGHEGGRQALTENQVGASILPMGLP